MTDKGAPDPNVTKNELPVLGVKKPMHLAVSPLPERPRIAVSSVDRDIRDFLAGKTHGEGLLHKLYDHVLDEPVPERLRALLRR